MQMSLFARTGNTNIYRIPGGEIRRVAVDRKVLKVNLGKDRPHPAMVVTDLKGTKKYFHAIKVNGLLEYSRNPGHASIQTSDDIYCHWNTDEGELYIPVSFSFKETFTSLWNKFRGLPVVSCFIG